MSKLLLLWWISLASGLYSYTRFSCHEYFFTCLRFNPCGINSCLEFSFIFFFQMGSFLCQHFLLLLNNLLFLFFSHLKSCVVWNSQFFSTDLFVSSYAYNHIHSVLTIYYYLLLVRQIPVHFIKICLAILRNICFFVNFDVFLFISPRPLWGLKLRLHQIQTKIWGKLTFLSYRILLSKNVKRLYLWRLNFITFNQFYDFFIWVLFLKKFISSI